MRNHVRNLKNRLAADFRARLKLVLGDAACDEEYAPGYEDWQKLEKEIYTWHPEVLNAILHKVAHGHRSNSLEFWENVQSFIGNCFYDDNYVTIGRTMYDYPVLAWGHYGYRKEHHVTPDDVRKMASLYLVEKTTDCEKSAKEWRQADMAVRDFGMRYPRMEKVSKELRRMRKEQREFFKRAGIKRKEQ